MPAQISDALCLQIIQYQEAPRRSLKTSGKTGFVLLIEIPGPFNPSSGHKKKLDAHDYQNRFHSEFHCNSEIDLNARLQPLHFWLFFTVNLEVNYSFRITAFLKYILKHVLKVSILWLILTWGKDNFKWLPDHVSSAINFYAIHTSIMTQIENSPCSGKSVLPAVGEDWAPT